MRTRFYSILWPFVGPRNTYTCSCSWNRLRSSAHRLWRGSAGWGVHSEIAELMAVKSKYGGGPSEYNPDWMPKVRPPRLLPCPPSPSPPFKFSYTLTLTLDMGHIQHEEPAPASPALPPAPSVIEDAAPARPAWRTVHKREERRAKVKAKALPAPAAAPPALPPPPEAANLPAWAQWKRTSSSSFSVVSR